MDNNSIVTEGRNAYSLISPAEALATSEAVVELERLLAQERRRNDELNHTLREREEVMRRMEDVLATASHDLKSPLSAILLNVQSVLQNSRPLPRWMRPRLARVETLVRQSAQLVSDILSVERYDHGATALHPEEIELKDLVHQVIGMFQEQLEAFRCPVVISAGEAVRGRWDRLCLMQIVTNLVSNAIKYGNGNPFEIAVACAGNRAQLTIADQGIGLCAADQQRLFQRFEQVRPTEAWKGSGLGLWIVTKAVRNLGGHIKISSAPGGGTTFLVDLPLHT